MQVAIASVFAVGLALMALAILIDRLGARRELDGTREAPAPRPSPAPDAEPRGPEAAPAIPAPSTCPAGESSTPVAFAEPPTTLWRPRENPMDRLPTVHAATAAQDTPPPDEILPPLRLPKPKKRRVPEAYAATAYAPALKARADETILDRRGFEEASTCAQLPREETRDEETRDEETRNQKSEATVLQKPPRRTPKHSIHPRLVSRAALTLSA